MKHIFMAVSFTELQIRRGQKTVGLKEPNHAFHVMLVKCEDTCVFSICQEQRDAYGGKVIRIDKLGTETGRLLFR